MLKAILSLLAAVANMFMARRLLDAGKAEQAKIDMDKVIEHEQKAEAAVRIDDPARAERLRNKFDRSRSK